MIPNLRPSVAPRRHAHVAGERNTKGIDRAVACALRYLCHTAVVAPQQVSWHLLASIPLSLIVFLAAFGGWLALDAKGDSRFTYRQGLICLLLIYCGYTTTVADFPVEAATKWAWVWKALITPSNAGLT